MHGDRVRRRLAWAWLAVVVVAIAHNGWVWIVKHRRPETDLLALLPSDERNPVVSRAVAQVADASQQYVVVLVGDRDWARARSAGLAYANALKGHSEWLEVSPSPALEQNGAIGAWWSRRTALLAAEDRSALVTTAPDAWARTALRDLVSPMGAGRVGTWQDDPFSLFRNWLQARMRETPVRPADGVLRVDDGDMRYVVLPVRLREPAFSFAAQRVVMPLLEGAKAAALGAAPEAKVIAAGLIFPAEAAARQADHEMSTIGWGSLIGIVLLTWLALRSLQPIGMVLLSIVVGTVGAVSVTAAIYPKVHLITLVFGASLIGVAADYGLSYLCNAGRLTRGRWEVMRESLPGLTLGLVTTVVAFLGLALTPFPGLQQIAVFATVGLVFSWITVAIWFPRFTGAPTGASRLGTWFGRTRAQWPIATRSRAAIAIAVCAAAAIAVGLARLVPNDDVRLLQNAPPGMIEEQADVGRILQVASVAQFYVVRAASESKLLEREEALRARLDSLVVRGALTGYQAVSTWVPSIATQQKDQALVRDRLYQPSGALDRLASALGEGADWTNAARRAAAAPVPPLTVKDWLDSPVSEPLRHLWLGTVDGDVASVVALKGINYDKLALLGAAAAGMPGVVWADKLADVSSLIGRYRTLMSWVIAGGYAAVWLMLLPRYGRRAWRVLAPSVIASLAALAVFGWVGHPLQLFHVLALLVIFGSGVDYAIFLLERPSAHAGDTWLGVGLAAMSTVLSFGLLALSGTPVLQAFGTTMLIGITISMLAAPYFCTIDDRLLAPSSTTST